MSLQRTSGDEKENILARRPDREYREYRTIPGLAVTASRSDPPHSFMLSFIVPAHNEETELPGSLEAVRSAAERLGESYEIVVADDSSTDATAKIASQFGARVVSVQCRQIAAARNAGAREARGQILFFVDADTRIGPEHITGALRALREDVPVAARASGWTVRCQSWPDYF